MRSYINKVEFSRINSMQQSPQNHDLSNKNIKKFKDALRIENKVILGDWRLEGIF